MKTILSEAQTVAEPDFPPSLPGEQDIRDPNEPEAEPTGSAVPDWLRRMLTAETGPGEIADYLTHPLNPKNSEWLAQVLRGLTGMFGTLRLAVLDIAMGGFKAVAARQETAHTGGLPIGAAPPTTPDH